MLFWTVCPLDELVINFDAVEFWVMLCLTVGLLGEVASDDNDVAVEIESLLCSLLKAQTAGMGLNDTLLAVDLNEPIDTSSSTAIKLDPVVPRETLSQSINQLMSASMIA